MHYSNNKSSTLTLNLLYNNITAFDRVLKYSAAHSLFEGKVDKFIGSTILN